MELEELKAQLNNNIEILNNTFEALGLDASKCNVIEISESGEFDLGVEVRAVEGQSSIQQDVTIKAAAYNQDGNIVGVTDAYLYKDSFTGFDVLWIYLNVEGAAFRTHSIKVFAKEG